MANLFLVMDETHLKRLNFINKITLYTKKSNRWSRQSLRSGQSGKSESGLSRRTTVAGVLNAFGGSVTPCWLVPANAGSNAEGLYFFDSWKKITQ